MGGPRPGIYHTYLIITITGNGVEEVGALAVLISVTCKHALARTHLLTHKEAYCHLVAPDFKKKFSLIKNTIQIVFWSVCKC